jgi:cytoskeletal protein CcmA (bactofilin family)
MAISGFGRGKGEESTGSGPPPPAAPTGNLSAFIDQGSTFEGKLSFRDTVRIDGGFKGEISSENTLIVGETGEIDAIISSKSVVVSGTVHGNICAGEGVVLHKSAKVEGDIESPSIVIEKGAIFNGRLAMTKGGSNSSANSNLKAVLSGGSADKTSAKG